MKKDIFAGLVAGVELLRLNHGEAVYIINSARNCISPMRSIVYHQADREYTPWGVMIYNSLCELMIYRTSADDIPSLVGLDRKKHFF